LIDWLIDSDSRVFSLVPCPRLNSYMLVFEQIFNICCYLHMSKVQNCRVFSILSLVIGYTDVRFILTHNAATHLKGPTLHAGMSEPSQKEGMHDTKGLRYLHWNEKMNLMPILYTTCMQSIKKQYLHIHLHRRKLLHILWMSIKHRDVCATDQCHHQWRSVTLQLAHQTDAASSHSHTALLIQKWSCLHQFHVA